VSCTFVLKHVHSALVASTKLVQSIAWVHAILVSTLSYVHHLMIWVLNVAKCSVDCLWRNTIHHKLHVEVVSVGLSASFLDRLSNLWLEL